jgi:methylated-DNA-protein-cysteine methyltransferase related protein
MTDFKQQVLAIVAAIPQGKVMSYGQVAAATGNPRAAREVGWVLNGFDGSEDFPWWRVVNKEGVISIKGTMMSTANVQKQKLEAEGVVVSDEFQIDMEKYRYNL